MNFKKFFSVFITVLSLLLMVLALVILLVSINTSKNEIPSLGGYSMMRVVTGSMEPELPTKSVVLVKRRDGDESPEKTFESISEGDIIAFYSADPTLAGMVICHRVVGKEMIGGVPYLITKGDANPSIDAYPVAMSAVVGKVVWNSHSLGNVIALMLNPLFFFPVIILPLLILIIINMIQAVQNIRKAASKDKEEAIREAIQRAKENEAIQENEDREKENPIDHQA